MNNQIEEWKVCKDTRKYWNGALWEVSTCGRVRKNGEDYELKHKGTEYFMIGGVRLHRIIAELFIPNPENLPCIDHIDRNKYNNHVSNLRWCTYQENNQNKDWETIKQKMSGEGNPRYGTHHTEDAKRRISESEKDKFVSEETRKKQSASLKGKKRAPFSEEAKRRISESHKGLPSPFKGRHHTEESKAKFRESIKKYWEKRKREAQ